jgi:hypothetical protein
MQAQVIRQSIGPISCLYTSPDVEIISCVGQVFQAQAYTKQSTFYRPGFVQTPLRLRDDASILDDVQLYPNPAANGFYLKMDQGEEVIELTAQSMNGMTYSQIKLAGGQQNYIDCSSWAAGMYLIQLRQGASIKQIKFIKL